MRACVRACARVCILHWVGSPQLCSALSRTIGQRVSEGGGGEVVVRLGFLGTECPFSVFHKLEKQCEKISQSLDLCALDH